MFSQAGQHSPLQYIYHSLFENPELLMPFRKITKVWHWGQDIEEIPVTSALLGNGCSWPMQV
jgi:hypothetical protein